MKAFSLVLLNRKYILTFYYEILQEKLRMTIETDAFLSVSDDKSYNFPSDSPDWHGTPLSIVNINSVFENNCFNNKFVQNS